MAQRALGQGEGHGNHGSLKGGWEARGGACVLRREAEGKAQRRGARGLSREPGPPPWSGVAGVKQGGYVGWRAGAEGTRGPAHHTKGRGHRSAQAWPGTPEGIPREG